MSADVAAAGVKHDGGKARWDLLPLRAAGAVVDVLTFGARKYDDENWRRVPRLRRRYFAAALRHLVAWRMGERLDAESGLPHLAHAATCLFFLLEHELGGCPDAPADDADTLTKESSK